MNAKEAFRYLSHRFHGKGSGKKKTEKRMKKMEEEQVCVTTYMSRIVSPNLFNHVTLFPKLSMGMLLEAIHEKTDQIIAFCSACTNHTRWKIVVRWN